jgi:hypothetical protein
MKNNLLWFRTMEKNRKKSIINIPNVPRIQSSPIKINSTASVVALTSSTSHIKGSVVGSNDINEMSPRTKSTITFVPLSNSNASLCDSVKSNIIVQV